MVDRLDDWRARLQAYLATTATLSFRPGTHDCILFAAGAREALTGVNPMAGWAGLYTTIEGGLELARAHGCDDPYAHVTEGLDAVPPAFAQVGDIALLPGIDGRPALGVVLGEMVATVGLRGGELAPLALVTQAWRVG